MERPEGFFPFHKQTDPTECGPACLRIIAEYYGKPCSMEYLRELCSLKSNGTSIFRLGRAASQIGMRSLAVRVSYENLGHMPLPAIAHWYGIHFVVIYRIGRRDVHVADPALGKISYSRAQFLKGWLRSDAHNTNEGVLLLLEPVSSFRKEDDTRTAGHLGQI